MRAQPVGTKPIKERERRGRERERERERKREAKAITKSFGQMRKKMVEAFPSKTSI